MRFFYCVFLVFIGLFLGSCNADAKTKGTKQDEMLAVLYQGETREIPLGTTTQDLGNELDVSLSRSNVVRSYLAYSSKNPSLHLKAVNSGKQDIDVGYYKNIDNRMQLQKTLRIKVVVLSSGTKDLIGGGGNGGESGSEDPNTPPVPPGPTPPEIDPNACSYSNAFYRVTDDWADVEGKYGEDFAARLQSRIIVNIDSSLTLFYPRISYKQSPPDLVSLGTYSVNTPEKTTIIFQLDLAEKLFGTEKYFYIKWKNYCFRGMIPSSPFSPPQKNLKRVFSV